jgi:hypothetical protein
MLTTQPNPTTPNPTVRTKGAAAPAEWIPADAWAGFVEMRKKARSTMTDRAVKLIVTKLEKLKADGFDPGEVLDQSTLSNWKGVYPLNRNGNPRNPEQSGVENGIQSQVLGTTRKAKNQLDALEAFRQAEARRNSRMGDSDGHSDGDGDRP